MKSLLNRLEVIINNTDVTILEEHLTIQPSNIERHSEELEIKRWWEVISQ